VPELWKDADVAAGGAADLVSAAGSRGGCRGDSPQAERQIRNAVRQTDRTVKIVACGSVLMQIGRAVRVFEYRHGVLDLGPRARVVFAACWIAGQCALVVTAPLRSDHIFGFRMFPEASTLEIHLSRITAGATLPVPSGEWSASDARGQLRHFSWRDRVRDPVLAAVDVRVFASYGVDAQLARLQRALDDVADHLDGDDETRRLRADVIVRKNGGEASTRVLFSHARRGG